MAKKPFRKKTNFASQNNITMKTALLLIDCQYDFANPNGTLFVKGADKDMERLSEWIMENIERIDSITMTVDSHQPHDISHPGFWQDSSGRNPAPFTQIKLSDVQSGMWNPMFEPEKVVRYLTQLESQGEYPHMIWPEHCLTGSLGASVVGSVMDAVTEWSRRKMEPYRVIIKGEYQFSEHFGAFRAQVPVPERDDTKNNVLLMGMIRNHDVVYVAGEAKSHCVASTINQAAELLPEHVKKFVILEDCMSDVEGLGHLGEPTYNKVREMGAKFEKTALKETETV
jgi:nicotinamidase/pyrazinamidase